MPEPARVLDESRGPATELRITPQATIAAVEHNGFKLRDVIEVGPQSLCSGIRPSGVSGLWT